jgi:hypothetical protein
MNKYLLLAATAALTATSAQAATVLLDEDFEDSTVTYIASPAEYSDGSNDFFTRVGPGAGQVGSNYDVSGFNGNFYFAAQDLDAEGTNPSTLTFSGIDISNFENLQFSFQVAEDDASGGWDRDNDFFSVSASIDGGSSEEIFRIENDGDQFNSSPFVDTDFDGTGEGDEITDTFQTFSADIAGTGSSLDLVLTFSLDSGDEDLAIDDVIVSGTVIPEPMSVGLAMVGLGGLVLRRRQPVA